MSYVFVNDWYVAPTSSGEIRWRVRPWGVEVQEHFHDGLDVQTIRLPWVTLAEIRSTSKLASLLKGVQP